jgi:hypothetical protein
MLKELEKELELITQKFRFIKAVSTEEINFKNMNKSEMNQELKNKNYKPLSEDGDYEYLLRMPIWSLCKDKMLELEKQMKEK